MHRLEQYVFEHNFKQETIAGADIDRTARSLVRVDPENIKIWNLRNRTCTRTIESGYALCCVFTPSNRHVVVGTKGGTLELYDIPSATCLATIEAHSGAVWSVALTADGRGLVSGSADHDVKFWDFELVEVEINTGQVTSQIRRPSRRRIMLCN